MYTLHMFIKLYIAKSNGKIYVIMDLTGLATLYTIYYEASDGHQN